MFYQYFTFQTTFQVARFQALCAFNSTDKLQLFGSAEI